MMTKCNLNLKGLVFSWLQLLKRAEKLLYFKRYFDTIIKIETTNLCSYIEHSRNRCLFISHQIKLILRFHRCPRLWPSSGCWSCDRISKYILSSGQFLKSACIISVHQACVCSKLLSGKMTAVRDKQAALTMLRGI